MGQFKSKSSTAVDDNSDEYQVKKGLALLLWNDGGDLGSAPKNDRDTIETTLSMFDIVVLKEGGNLRASEVGNLVRKVIKQMKNYDIFICAMIGHGIEVKDGKYMRHAVKFKDGYLPSDVIVNYFNENENPSLKGKPRIFFIDACRSRPGENPYIETNEAKVTTKIRTTNGKDTKCDDRGNESSNIDKTTQSDVECSSIVTRDVPYRPTPLPNLPDQQIEMVSSLCNKDCLVMFASPPGKNSFQVTRKGRSHGLLAYGLKKAFKRFSKLGSEIDLLDALTYASFVIAYSFVFKPEMLDDDKVELFGVENDCASVTYIEHRLTKDIVLHINRK